MRWAVLGLLFVASFVAYLVRMNLSVAAKLMMPELGISEVQMGWIFSAFIWSYALCQFPGGVFAELAGPRRALAVTGLLWVAITIITGLVPGQLVRSTAGILASLLLLRLLMGVVQAPLFPITAAAIVEWFPVGGWAFPNGLLSTGLSLGAAATPPLVAWVMVELGWRASFYTAAPLALIVIAAWWWYATDRPHQHAGVSVSELALIRGERQGVVGAVGSRHAMVRRLLGNREILLLSLSYLSMNYVFYFFFSWFYLYLVNVRGFGILEGGFWASLPFVAGALAASAGGLTCDRLCQRLGPAWGCRLPCLVGLATVAALLILGAAAENSYLAVALLSLCFGATQFTEGAYWSATMFVAGRHTGAATGILNTGGNLGGVLSTPLAPLLAERFGWLAALASGSVFALLGAFLWLFIRADHPLEEAELATQ